MVDRLKRHIQLRRRGEKVRVRLMPILSPDKRRRVEN